MGRERVHLHENEIRTYQRDTISLFLLFRERIQSLKIPSIFFLSLSLSLFPIPSYLPPYEFSILYSMYQFVRIFYPVKDKIERAFDLLIRLIISTFFRIDEMTEEVLYGRRWRYISYIIFYASRISELKKYLEKYEKLRKS